MIFWYNSTPEKEEEREEEEKMEKRLSDLM